MAQACSGCCSKGLLKQRFQGSDWENLLRNVEDLDPRPRWATYKYEVANYWIGCRGNLRETIVSPANIGFSSNFSLKPIQ